MGSEMCIRDRLYLDAVQSVMSNSTKVMIDVKNGNNIMYLPLDQIAAASSLRPSEDQNNNSTTNGLNPNAIEDLTDAVIEEIRKRQGGR